MPVNIYKKCPRCGSVLSADARFCVKCGTDLANVPVQVPAAARTQNPAPQAQYTAGTQTVQMQAPSAPRTQNMCPRCGAPIAPDSSFCLNCGAALRTVQAPQGRYCLRCGSELRHDSNFCLQCGTPVRPGLVNAVASQVPQGGYSPAVSGAYFAAPQPQAKTKNRYGFINFLLLIICAALIWAGIRYIPDNLKDLGLPPVTIEENDISEQVLEVYGQIHEEYGINEEPYEEDEYETSESGSSNDDRMVSHWWYDTGTGEEGA